MAGLLDLLGITPAVADSTGAPLPPTIDPNLYAGSGASMVGGQQLPSYSVPPILQAPLTDNGTAVPPVPPSAAGPAPPVSTLTTPDVTVTPPAKAGNPAAGYGNLPELTAINAAAAQDNPQAANNPIGHFMQAHPTLRTMLGTLGDAFLVQSGHQPVYQPQQEAMKVARAAAGFDVDPTAAAARIAATGAPGSMQDAANMYNAANTLDLKKQMQEQNNAYRQGNLQAHQEQVDSQVAARKEQAEQRARATMGSILAAGAASKDPNAFARAQAQAKALGSRYIENFDPDLEIPTTADQFNAGMGMTASQYGRQQTSQSSIQERANAASQSNATKRYGIAAGVGNNQYRVNHTDAANVQRIQAELNDPNGANGDVTKLPPADQDLWKKHTNIPSKSGGTSLNIPGLSSGPIHTYPSGRQVQWNGKAWVPLKH